MVRGHSLLRGGFIGTEWCEYVKPIFFVIKQGSTFLVFKKYSLQTQKAVNTEKLQRTSEHASKLQIHKLRYCFL